MLAEREVTALDAQVSIHAPRCRGAMRRTCTEEEESTGVSIHAPRCRGAMPDSRKAMRKHQGLFQSTPPVAEGRCPLNQLVTHQHSCFNPRPPLPRGDAGYWTDSSDDANVSIHAPRCRGAMLIFHNIRKQKNKIPALREPFAYEQQESYAK